MRSKIKRNQDICKSTKRILQFFAYFIVIQSIDATMLNTPVRAQAKNILLEIKDDMDRDVVFTVMKYVDAGQPVVVKTADVVQQIIKQNKLVEIENCDSNVYKLRFDNLFYIDEFYEIRECNRQQLNGNKLSHRVAVGKRMLVDAIAEISWIGGDQAAVQFGITDPNKQNLFRGFVRATGEGNNLVAGLIADRISEVLIDSERSIEATKYAAYNFAVIGDELGVNSFVNVKQLSSAIDGTVKYALTPTDMLTARFNQAINSQNSALLPTMKIFIDNKEEMEKKRIQTLASEYTGLPVSEFSLKRN